MIKVIIFYYLKIQKYNFKEFILNLYQPTKTSTLIFDNFQQLIDSTVSFSTSFFNFKCHVTRKGEHPLPYKVSGSYQESRAHKALRPDQMSTKTNQWDSI